MLTGRQGSFQARDRWRLRSHTLRYLRLGKARLLACLEQSIQQNGFFTLDALNLGSDTRAAHELLYDLIMRLHALSPSVGFLRSRDHEAAYVLTS